LDNALIFSTTPFSNSYDISLYRYGERMEIHSISSRGYMKFVEEVLFFFIYCMYISRSVMDIIYERQYTKCLVDVKTTQIFVCMDYAAYVYEIIGYLLCVIVFVYNLAYLFIIKKILVAIYVIQFFLFYMTLHLIYVRYQDFYRTRKRIFSRRRKRNAIKKRRQVKQKKSRGNGTIAKEKKESNKSKEKSLVKLDGEEDDVDPCTRVKGDAYVYRRMAYQCLFISGVWFSTLRALESPYISAVSTILALVVYSNCIEGVIFCMVDLIHYTSRGYHRLRKKDIEKNTNGIKIWSISVKLLIFCLQFVETVASGLLTALYLLYPLIRDNNHIYDQMYNTIITLGVIFFIPGITMILFFIKMSPAPKKKKSNGEDE